MLSDLKTTADNARRTKAPKISGVNSIAHENTVGNTIVI